MLLLVSAVFLDLSLPQDLTKTHFVLLCTEHLKLSHALHCLL